MSFSGGEDGNGRGGQGGSQPEQKFERISDFIIDRLFSDREEIVLNGIRDLMRAEEVGRKYDPCAVAEVLAELIQSSKSEKVMEAAGDALVERLGKGISFGDAQKIIAGQMGGKAEKNAGFFIKMLDRMKYESDLRLLAVEMLAGFRGVELSPGTIDGIEMALFQKLVDPRESEEVKKAIEDRFGKEGRGRPQIIKKSGADETVALEAGSGAGRASAEVMRAGEIPTKGMDVVAGLLLQLKDGGPLQKERAAMELIRIVEGSKDRGEIKRIRDGVFPRRDEFPNLYRLALKAMQNGIAEWNSSKPPIALGPGNIRKLDGGRGPAPLAPLKR